MKLYCIYRCFNTQNYIYPFQNFSLGFILKIFLKFRKFQPRYSYKIYSYKKKKTVIWIRILRISNPNESFFKKDLSDQICRKEREIRFWIQWSKSTEAQIT